MTIIKGKHLNAEAFILENDLLRLAVLPSIGAKLASLIYKPSSFEVFSQPSNATYRTPIYGAPFSNYDTSGADDMFPSIDECPYPYKCFVTGHIPDHGDLWASHWKVTIENNSLLCHIHGKSLPYIFERRITLLDDRVRLDYSVTNLKGIPIYGLWAFHGLVNCDTKSRIILPGVERVVNVQSSTRLGDEGTPHSFPQTTHPDGSQLRLDSIRPETANDTTKWYIDANTHIDTASITLNEGHLLYTLRYPKNEIPYLGVWLNEGGYKDEYNAALEPSNGYYDSLEVTRQTGKLEPIAPHQTREWYLEIKLDELKKD